MSNWSARRLPMLLSGFIVVMGVAWLMATPPGSAPDEGAHYIKAIAVGRGEFYGEPAVATAAERRAFFKADRRVAARLLRQSRTPAARWQRRTIRQFRIPPSLVDPRFGCTSPVFGPDITGACLDAPTPPVRRRTIRTYTGTYQPYVYVAPGIAMRVAGGPRTALRVGRAATLAVAGALLIAAVWLLWTSAAPGLSLAGLVVAMTPMVLFMASVLNPSGPEIAGAICFAAALLRLVRDDPAPPWTWAAIGAGGVVLAAARALGPAFVVLDLVAIALLAGPGRLAARLRSGRRIALAAGAAIVIAALASVAWEFARQPRPEPSATSLTDALRPAISGLPSVGRQAVGVFGWLDAPMPRPAYWAWAVLLAALLVAGFVAGGRRDRLSLGALVAGAGVVTIGMTLVYREIGPLHGRYALPVLVLVPLWAGEVLLRRRDRLSPAVIRSLVGASFAVAAVIHAVGWWASGRRFAVGRNGAWLFLADAEWRPPLGWLPWLAAVLVATLALAGAGIARSSARRPA